MIHGDTELRDERAVTATKRGRPLPFGALRRRRDGVFLLGVLVIGGLTALILGAMGAPRPASKPTVHAVGQTSNALPIPTEQTGNSTLPGVRAAHIRAWGTVPGDAGVMLPALDQQGNVWFGEMFTNKLGRLNPQTGAITTWTAPNGRYNIMDTAVDAQGDIWYTEQAANYIGRFNATTEKFTQYPLGASAAPQDLVFDTSGNLWFTQFSSKGKVGRLVPATGAITTWDIPDLAPGQHPYPFSVAPLPNGDVWFGDLSGGAIGKLDPTTGAVATYRLGDPSAGVYAMAADKQGRVWFVEYQSGRLGYVDTQTGKITELAVPSTLGVPAGMYAVVVGSDGKVWFTCNGCNAIVEYAPASGGFTFFQLPIQQSVPFGMVMDAHGTLWFTAGGQPNNYVGAVVR